MNMASYLWPEVECLHPPLQGALTGDPSSHPVLSLPMNPVFTLAVSKLVYLRHMNESLIINMRYSCGVDQGWSSEQGSHGFLLSACWPQDRDTGLYMVQFWKHKSQCLYSDIMFTHL